jgi:hypothetical protein
MIPIRVQTQSATDPLHLVRNQEKKSILADRKIIPIT